jgi:hypothetical protein
VTLHILQLNPRNFSMKYAAAWAGISLALLCSAAVHADCPNDLTALSAQISNPTVRASLNRSLDEQIQRLGGLDAALAKTQASLSSIKRAMADGRFEAALQKNPATAAQQRVAFMEGVKIAEAFVAALQCRKAQQAATN